MSSVTDHDLLVVAKFGPNADAYVASAAHATGADLGRLAAIAAARAGCRILDLGCGGGHVSFAVAPHAAEVVAYDLSDEMLAAVRAEAERRELGAIRTLRGGAETLAFEDASFDLVMTRFSAHHWGDLPGALGEMHRVVKQDGLVVVVDTISPEAAHLDAFLNRIELLRDPSHLRNRTAVEWERALGDAGLRPSQPTLSRLRLDFAAWVARIGTPDADARAILALEAAAPADVSAHFALEPDGSFTIDVMLIEACPRESLV